MRMHMVAAAALGAALSAGCSSSPSDGDVKKVVEGMIAGCPYFSLDKYKKLNGVEAGEGRYAVDVVFTVKVAPVPGAKDLVEKSKADATAVNERLAAFLKAKAQANATENAYDDRIVAATRAGDRALEASLLTEKIQFVNSLKQMDRDIDYLQRLQREVNQRVVGPIHSKFSQDCPNVHDMIRVYEPEDLEQYTKTFTKDFAGTLPLVKTDNGWRAVF
jgi:hypothetical protein